MSKKAISDIASQIAQTDRHLSNMTSTSQSNNIKAGHVAEELHAESFNLAAISQGDPLRAHTERHEGFSNSGYERNGTSDIVVTDGSGVFARHQSKYHATPEKTAVALRALCQDGSPKYLDHGLLVPADQKEPVKLEARRTRLKNEMPIGRPAVARAAGMVEQKASDRLSHRGVESRPLSLHDARAIAKNPDGPERRAHLEPQILPVLQKLKASEEADGRVFDPDKLFEAPTSAKLHEHHKARSLIISMAKAL
jgi:hypothetical protein